MKVAYQLLTKMVNVKSVNQEDYEKVRATAANIALGLIFSLLFHTISYFLFDPYPWWVFSHFAICHIASIVAVLREPTNLNIFSLVFMVYANTVGPIWLYYSSKMIICALIIQPVIPLVFLMTSRNREVSFFSMGIECAKALWIFPRLLKVIIQTHSQEELWEIIDEGFIITAILLIIIFFVFYFFYIGIIKKERLITAMQAELAVANENLKQSLKDREMFILSLSHEVRNPLNVVLGNIELCYEEAIDQSLKERLKSAKICGDLLLSLINNVLDAGKAELDNVEVCPTECAVVPLFEKIWSSCKEMIKNKGLKATISGLDTLPSYIKLDQHRMTQIMFNLIGNAVKFTEKGGISLNISWKDKERGDTNSYLMDTFEEARIEELPSSKDLRFFSPKLKPFLQSPPMAPVSKEREGVLTIDITDTVYGIPPEGIKCLFQKFSQISSSQQKKLGTGLGLWITKKICEKMNGDISVTSEPGKTTTFSVKINTTAMNLLNKFHSSQSLTLSHIPSFSRKYSVMIVEDVVFNANIIAKMIADCNGFEIVTIAENGLKTVEYYEKSIKEGRQVNVITMDLEMPVMDGKKACKRIRELEEKYHVRPCYIIIITGNCLDTEVTECLNPNGSIRAQQFLRKPLRKEDFITQMTALYKMLHFEAKKSRQTNNVLIVDDDQFNVTLLKGMLEKKKINTLVSKNGLEALEIFKSNHETIDIIFMDCEMAVMDGWTATEKIISFCKENKLKMPRIYGLTGYSDKDIEQKCLNSGMIEMIKKPVSLYELTRRISEV